MFDHAGAVERAGTDRVGSSTTAVVRAGVGSTAPATDPLGLLRDTTAAARRLADLDWSSLAADEVDRALTIQRQLDGAVASIRTSLVTAAAGSVVDAAGAGDVTNLVRDRLGLSGRDARKAAALADGLDGLDATREDLRDGRIGAESARLVAEAVADGRLGEPDHAEPRLLERARTLDPDRLARWIRRRQAAASPESLEEQEKRALRRRGLWGSWTKDGMYEGRFRLPQLTGAMFETAMGAYATVDPADTPDEDRRTFVQRQADALHDLLGEALSAPAAGRPGRVRPHVLVVGTVETFREGTGVADLDGRPISAELARRIACDAGMSRLLVDASSMPLDLGRETRNWSAGQRRAIVARDGHCRGPGCDRPATWCDIHHIEWWERDGGPTDLDNGLLLCGRHHDLVHHGGWTVTLDPRTARATWTSRLGAVVETSPAGVLAAIAEAERARAPANGPIGGSAGSSVASEAPGRYRAGRPEPSALSTSPGSTGPGPLPARRRTSSRRAPGRRLVGVTGRHGRAP